MTVVNDGFYVEIIIKVGDVQVKRVMDKHEFSLSQFPRRVLVNKCESAIQDVLSEHDGRVAN